MGDELENFEHCEILPDYYVIESILDKKRQKGVWKYKVKWEGYPMDQCTWEPFENLANCKELFKQFELDWNQKKNIPKSLPKSSPTESSSIINDDIESLKLSASPALSSVNSNSKIISDECDMEMKPTEIIGDFDSDIGEAIINAKIMNTKDIELNCLVKWRIREDGTQCVDTWISSNVVRKRDPELLLKFYEARIKLPAQIDQKSNPNNNFNKI